MSYAINYADLWRRAARYVDKILQGMTPGDLPVEQPTRFETHCQLQDRQDDRPRIADDAPSPG